MSGINLLELINDKISNLDRALKSVDSPSDTNKNQALITSEKLRVNAIQNGLILFIQVVKNFVLIIVRVLKGKQDNKYNNLLDYLLLNLHFKIK